MDKTTTIGLDLAKNVFHVVCCNEHGKMVRKKMLKRSKVGVFCQPAPLSGGNGSLRQRPPLGTRTGGSGA